MLPGAQKDSQLVDGEWQKIERGLDDYMVNADLSLATLEARTLERRPEPPSKTLPTPGRDPPRRQARQWRADEPGR